MGSGEFLNINFFTALFTLANTVALFLVLKKYLFKPVLKMIETRQKEIDDLYADAGNAKQQAQLLEAEYRQKLDAAAETGDRLVKEATVRAQNRKGEKIKVTGECLLARALRHEIDHLDGVIFKDRVIK